MKLLVLDGNSIINRAFYGIKLLSTKSGIYTNAVYGFLNILLKLKEISQPDAIGVAFDVHAPTFRHKKYDEYKAGRHAMPDELRMQMPILKDILKSLGIKTVECEGWEADDILGTLAQACRSAGNECFIATGDRDSLQLAHGGVKVLLAHTKSGRPVTDIYDENTVMEEYGVTPAELIQVKALQGDSSDNIPGVAGVGAKTALDLIQRFHNIDYIYENLDEIDIKKGVREKLARDKDKAYLSLDLGTIRTNAPVDTDINSYIPGDNSGAAMLLAKYELYSLIDKFGLNAQQAVEPVRQEEKATVTVKEMEDPADFSFGEELYFTFDIENNEISRMYFANGDTVITVSASDADFEDFVKRLFESDARKYSYNTKYLHRLAATLGTDCKNVCGDLMLSAYLLRPSDSNYDIDHLCLEYGIALPDGGEESQNAVYAAVLKRLFEKTDVLLKEANQTDLLNNIELPLARVLAKMETAGFAVDKKGIEDFGNRLGSRIDELIAQIYSEADREFNVNSPKQLGTVLFEEMQIPCKKKTKSGYSTKAEVLEELAPDYPIVKLILEYRSLAKLKSTYCDGLLKVIQSDGRIHTSFNQVETRTGRISSLEPNLQNIPIRTELGREMRRFFVAESGSTLIDADYSQIELRVLAALANDENMINAFNNGEDIHKTTAAQVFNLPREMVTPLLRSRAKAVNFGIVYGIGAFSLAKDIGVSVKEAKDYINGYLHHFSGVAEYMDKMIETAKDNGYAETLFHRRRYLPELASSNHMMRAFGERVARNMPIQGTAADVIKIAMIRVCESLEKENMKSRLILQVHDELIVESPADEAEKALQIVTREMENACKLRVRLVADGKIGKTWYDSH
uniref:DNA polymerase I n=1 Tax=Eubacterium sp. TaxID=142586 RepID=UPI004027D973